MEQSLTDKYAGWVGLGLLYMWGFATIPWANFSSSYQLWVKVISFLGAVLVSASGLAVLLYVGHLEERLRQYMEISNSNELNAD